MPTFLAGIWAKVAFGAAFVGLLLLAVFRLIGIGRNSERGAAAVDALQRTKDANEARANASRPISKDEEANDPFNRDNR
jgi:hypothetical protein